VRKLIGIATASAALLVGLGGVAWANSEPKNEGDSIIIRDNDNDVVDVDMLNHFLNDNLNDNNNVNLLGVLTD
jgi:hypothetical protein